MVSATRAIAMLLEGVMILWLVVVFTPGKLLGVEVTPLSPGTLATPAEMVLTAREGRLSLQAQDASLKAVFDAIGQQLSIEVLTRIPDDERVTLAFDELSLMEALKRFRPYVNYLVLEDAAKAPSRIRKLIVVSKRAAGMPERPTAQGDDAWVPPEPRQSRAHTPAAPARPKPFSFEFDPRSVGERWR